jgi:hypothetical protein
LVHFSRLLAEKFAGTPIAAFFAEHGTTTRRTISASDAETPTDARAIGGEFSM